MQIFLSHSSQDQELAKDLLDVLVESGGITPSTTTLTSNPSNGIAPGDNWLKVVRQRLTDATFIVLLITPNFLRSRFCQFEIGAAWALQSQRKRKCKIFPLLVGVSPDAAGSIPAEIQSVDVTKKDQLESWLNLMRLSQGSWLSRRLRKLLTPENNEPLEKFLRKTVTYAKKNEFSRLAENTLIEVCVDSSLLSASNPNIEPPTNWGHRAIYTSSLGVKTWLQCNQDLEYKPNEVNNQRADASNKTLRHLHYDTIVSLGPGDGKLDCQIFGSIPHLKYIPIDISPRLLGVTLSNASGKMTIPGAVVCDFEENLGFLAKPIQKWRGEKTVFSFLGNTIANIQISPRIFLIHLSQKLMHPGDLLLLEVGTGKDFSEDNLYEDEALPRLVASSVWPESGADLEPNRIFEDRIKREFVGSDSERGVTSGVNYRDTKRNCLLLSRRWYDPQRLVKWIHSEINLIHLESTPGKISENHGFCTLLFKKP